MNTDPAPSWLDAVVVIGLLFLLASSVYILAFVNVPDKNNSLFSALVGGVIGASLMAYVNNRWGSSKGSATKDSIIATMAAQTPPAPSATVSVTSPLEPKDQSK